MEGTQATEQGRDVDNVSGETKMPGARLFQDHHQGDEVTVLDGSPKAKRGEGTFEAKRVHAEKRPRTLIEGWQRQLGS